MQFNVKAIFVFLILVGIVSAGSYLIIIDASYSMDDYITSGQTMLEAAKDAAIDFVSASKNDEFAVMRFSHCEDYQGDYDHSPKKGNIRVIQEFTKDKAALNSSIMSIDTGPWTPIAAAIAEGREYVKSERNGKGTIILISDGEENCGGDPVEEANKTFREGIAVINVVSYAIDKADVNAAEQHQKIAVAGGGKYFSANNSEQLKEVLYKIKQEE